MKLQMVRTHLERWRELRAWGRSLANVAIEVSAREHPRRAGTCWPSEQRIVVYSHGRVAELLATGLHELAHAVEVLDGHGARWQARFAAAATEVTGIPVVGGCDLDYEIVDVAVTDAVRRWWRASGNELAERLLLKQTAPSKG